MCSQGFATTNSDGKGIRKLWESCESGWESLGICGGLSKMYSTLWMRSCLNTSVDRCKGRVTLRDDG